MRRPDPHDDASGDREQERKEVRQRVAPQDAHGRRFERLRAHFSERGEPLPHVERIIEALVCRSKFVADGLDLTLNAVTDLLRVSRNDAGHPTGRSIDRDDCFIHLRMFVRYTHKLYLLKAHLQTAAEV